jgi:hypothetical protein
MAEDARAIRWVSTRLAAVALLAMLTPSVASGQSWSSEPVAIRVRPASREALGLLNAGSARSATFREITATIERSDVIVYVETRPSSLGGDLQLAAVTPACRYLRVSVKTPGLPNEQVAWLAHELWHAVEIAGTPEVRDQASLLRFYARVGSAGRYTNRAETSAAQATWVRVLREMQDGK